MPRSLSAAVALFLGTALAFLLLEVAARGVERLLPPAEVMADITHARVFEPDRRDPRFVRTAPDLRLRAERATWVYPDQRFTRDKPAGVVRVGIVGGSNVFRLHAHHSALREQIESGLETGDQVEILNAGGNSQGSRGVLHAGQELLAFDLDVLVIYSGHNEYAESTVTRMLASGPVSRLATVRLVWRAWGWWITPARLAATAKEIAAVRAAEPVPSTTTPPPMGTALEPATPVPLGAPPPAMVAFEERLGTLVRAAQGAGTAVVIALPTTNLWHPTLLGEPGQGALPTPEIDSAYARGDYAEGMRLASVALRDAGARLQASAWETAALRRLAVDHDVRIADVDSAIRGAEPHGVPGETLFTDHCHLTPEGYALWVETVAPIVAQALRSRQAE